MIIFYFLENYFCSSILNMLKLFDNIIWQAIQNGIGIILFRYHKIMYKLFSAVHIHVFSYFTYFPQSMISSPTCRFYMLLHNLNLSKIAPKFRTELEGNTLVPHKSRAISLSSALILLSL